MPEAARAGLLRARHRLSTLLLRHGILYSGGKAWTQAGTYWLIRKSFRLPGAEAVFQDVYETVVWAAGRRDRLDVAISVMAADRRFPGGALVVAPAGDLDVERVHPRS